MKGRGSPSEIRPDDRSGVVGSLESARGAPTTLRAMRQDAEPPQPGPHSQMAAYGPDEFVRPARPLAILATQVVPGLDESQPVLLFVMGAIAVDVPAKGRRQLEAR